LLGAKGQPRRRAVLLEAACRGHATFVVDMTRTRLCAAAGLSVLVRAHKRAVAEGGELRLVIPTGAAVLCVFATAASIA
jgi:anti-anti-sigma regulatory factor